MVVLFAVQVKREVEFGQLRVQEAQRAQAAKQQERRQCGSLLHGIKETGYACKYTLGKRKLVGMPSIFCVGCFLGWLRGGRGKLGGILRQLAQVAPGVLG